MKEFSSLYADFTVSTRYDNLEPEVIHQAKKLILDLIGVSLAGYKLMEFPRMFVGYMAGLGGTPEATIIHTKKKFPAVNATLANAACAHSLDMDDGHRFAALHPGTVIIPAAIAAAELSQANTKKLIAGIVVGYEVMIRIGMAITPSSLNRGFHITGITGPFGAAAAAASIMKLSREEIIGALGLAGLQAAGILQVNHDQEGAKVKPINPARAAMSGLLSAILAKNGAKGPSEIFEGEDGFLKAFTGQVKKELLTKDLGKTFEICNTYIKLYAACRHVHACVDAALKILYKNPIEISEIKQISAETYPVAVRLSNITEVTTPSAGRFSIPFSIALALVKKTAGADTYSEENIKDHEIQSLSRKVRLYISDKWGEWYPRKRGATVRIMNNNGKEWSAEVDLAKGEPENPASLEEINNKFYVNATSLISDEEAKRLAGVILDLENLKVSDFTDLI